MTAKKTAKKPAVTKAKASSKKAPQKVDIYPNRVSLAVATLAAVSLVLFGLIALT